jgi:hypothetical protein
MGVSLPVWGLSDLNIGNQHTSPGNKLPKPPDAIDAPDAVHAPQRFPMATGSDKSSSRRVDAQSFGGGLLTQYRGFHE